MQVADFAYSYAFRNSLTFFTHVLLFVCGFHKKARVPQFFFRIQQNRLFSENFKAVHCLSYLLVESKKIKKSSKVADSAPNLKLACCGIRSHFTKLLIEGRRTQTLLYYIYTFHSKHISPLKL